MNSNNVTRSTLNDVCQDQQTTKCAVNYSSVNNENIFEDKCNHSDINDTERFSISNENNYYFDKSPVFKCLANNEKKYENANLLIG